ncbi:hypothetical protein [Methylocella tundrae]|uniref:hypothetical protein n=1 Tax=Methylocella tundrae TaxID=227605 RepID=UPI0030FE788F|nr:hypothetical protein SIN04_14615 [Methylocella tundrae]
MVDVRRQALQLVLHDIPIDHRPFGGSVRSFPFVSRIEHIGGADRQQHADDNSKQEAHLETFRLKSRQNGAGITLSFAFSSGQATDRHNVRPTNRRAAHQAPERFQQWNRFLIRTFHVHRWGNDSFHKRCFSDDALSIRIFTKRDRLMASYDLDTASDDLRTTARNVQKSTKEGVEAAQGNARKIAEKINDRISDGVNASWAAASDALDRARETAGGIGAAASETFDEGVGRAEEVLKSGGRDLAKRVGRQPLEALLLAGAVGYLIGYLLHKRD